MAFIDTAKIRVRGGTGGAGSKSMRREKYVELGGPDGGDGGRGASVWLEASSELRTLVDYSYLDHYEGPDGEKGGKYNCTGRSARDITLKVPCGTLVRDVEEGELLADLALEGQRMLAAKGGRGGRGNTHFVTSTRQAPRLAEKGEPGEERHLALELKSLADAALAGFPNAGKSSLLAACTAARPKIANYPFTTLAPQLGIVRLGPEESFALADLPGLIEGAAEGHGLGTRFLKHMERARVLLVVLDGAGTEGRDPKQDFEVLRRELAKYKAGLDRLPCLVAVNKMDLAEAREAWAGLKAFFRKRRIPAFAISAASRQGLGPLLKKTQEMLQTAPESPLAQAERAEAAKAKTKVYRPAERFTLDRHGEVFVLGGKEVLKWVAMTDFENEEAVRKLKNILDRLGVNEALRKAGAQEGDAVRVGREEFEYVP
jgi:GTP-binding protein